MPTRDREKHSTSHIDREKQLSLLRIYCSDHRYTTLRYTLRLFWRIWSFDRVEHKASTRHQ